MCLFAGASEEIEVVDIDDSDERITTDEESESGKSDNSYDSWSIYIQFYFFLSPNSYKADLILTVAHWLYNYNSRIGIRLKFSTDII